MKCPNCNSQLHAERSGIKESNARMKSSYNFGGVKVREYDCLKCGEKIGTVESVVKEFKKK